MTTEERLAQHRAELDVLKHNILNLSKQLLAEQSKVLFERHPTLVNFSWTQYTPYFNDGDECLFEVNRDWIKLNIDTDTEFEGNTYYTNKKVQTGKTWGEKPYIAVPLDFAILDIEKFLQNFSDEVLYELFGDHTRIVVSRDGVDVETYEHE